MSRQSAQARSISDRLRPAIGDPRRALALAAGDLLVIVAVVGLGYSHHGPSVFATPIEALYTLLPFVLGWPIPAVLAGVYEDGVIDDPFAAARYVTVAWIAAANIGVILRTSPQFDGTAVWPFALVVTGSVLVALLGWRVAAASVLD